ncbi:MAG: flagellar biosynthesis anti-sigma factor FlgM [Selenomonadaceae bacterium]
MIIENRMQAVSSVYAKNALTNQSKVKQDTTGTDKKDEIVLSTEAQSFSQTLQKVQAMSDFRQDKVDFYEAKISAGEYQTNSLEVAGKILDTRF